jgi:hypothetical protein
MGKDFLGDDWDKVAKDFFEDDEDDSDDDFGDE